MKIFTKSCVSSVPSLCRIEIQAEIDCRNSRAQHCNTVPLFSSNIHSEHPCTWAEHKIKPQIPPSKPTVFSTTRFLASDYSDKCSMHFIAVLAMILVSDKSVYEDTRVSICSGRALYSRCWGRNIKWNWIWTTQCEILLPFERKTVIAWLLQRTIGVYLTVLVTLLRCIVNCTAYPIRALCGPFPQKQGLRIKGLGWRFLTLTERALKEWRAIDRWVRKILIAVEWE